MTPFRRFCNGLHQVRGEFNEQLDEMIAFAEVMALKQNAVDLDDNGIYYITATGPIEEVVPVLRMQLEKLDRIKKEKENRH